MSDRKIPDRCPEIDAAEAQLGRHLTSDEKADLLKGRAAVVQGQLVESSTGTHASDARK